MSCSSVDVDVETSPCTILLRRSLGTCTKVLLFSSLFYSRIFLGSSSSLVSFLAVLLFLLLQVEALEIKLEKHCCHVCFGRLDAEWWVDLWSEGAEESVSVNLIQSYTLIQPTKVVNRSQDHGRMHLLLSDTL